MRIAELGPVNPSDLHSMVRDEHVGTIVRVDDGRLVEVPVDWSVPAWDDAKRDEICTRLAEVRGAGGAAWGAWSADALVALASIDPRPVGGDRTVLALDLFHVSAPYRGRGVSRLLMDEAVGFALGRGARAMYVSATCSVRTIAVYQHFGAVPADPPDPFWLAREPEDVHLVIPLPLRPGTERGMVV